MHYKSTFNMKTFTTWAAKEAESLLQTLNKQPPAKGYVLFETGYGPSGLPHIGTFAEVVRTTMVMDVLRHMDPSIKLKLFMVSDDMDGLRSVPTNIPNQEMVRQHLDKPLTNIPDPFQEKESYGHYMNSRLCSFLDEFGFSYEFKSASQMYKTGVYNEMLIKTLQHYDQIKAIMLPSLGPDRQKTYSPILPICQKTGKFMNETVKDINLQNNSVIYINGLGEEEETKVTDGNCKLQWKPDWGMRWAAFDVDYEMHGKDLTPSTVLSKKMCKVLGHKPPTLYAYELFSDAEGKKISKSKGNGLSIDEWLKYAPIESLKYYMFQEPRKARRLHFDIIPKMTDEYLQHATNYKNDPTPNNPAWYVQRGANANHSTCSISFSMLLNLASVCNPENKDVLWGFVRNYSPDASPEAFPYLDTLMDHAITYYRDFIMPNKTYSTPTANERGAIILLRDSLQNTDISNMESSDVQSIVFTVGKEANFDNMKDWFNVLYRVLFGQEQGPRMGSFIKLYGKNNFLELIKNKLGA